MIARDKLRGVKAFCDYTDAELDVLLAAGTLQTFEIGQDLCEQGEAAYGCFCVLDGVVDVLRSGRSGERLLGVVGEGALVGQLALTTRSRRSATLRAKSRVSVLVIARDDFDSLLTATSPIALRFQRHVAIAAIRQLRSAVSHLSKVLTLSTPPPATKDAAREEMLRYIDSTAGEMDVTVETLEKVRFADTGAQGLPKGRGPR